METIENEMVETYFNPKESVIVLKENHVMLEEYEKKFIRGKIDFLKKYLERLGWALTTFQKYPGTYDTFLKFYNCHVKNLGSKANQQIPKHPDLGWLEYMVKEKLVTGNYHMSDDVVYTQMRIKTVTTELRIFQEYIDESDDDE
jgi:hypothetical protein